MKFRVDKVRTSTAVLASAYPWHNGGQLRSVGPIVGIDRLAGDAPFGIDPFRWVTEGICQNANIVISGAPGNGKSAFVKSLLWWLCGALGYRLAVVDVKSEYRALADALGVPVLDLRPGGATRINPLDNPEGRLEFCLALAALCIARSVSPVERSALTGALRRLGDAPQLSDLAELLRTMPDGLADDLGMTPQAAKDATRDLRYGFDDLLRGPHAGMFDGVSTVDLTSSETGFVVDVSGAGRDDQALALSMLVGTRAIDQMVNATLRPTIVVNDEAWRLTAFTDLVKWLQYSSKLGRTMFAQANLMVVHRLAEVGAQADGVTGQIAARLVSDADTHISFRQGDAADAADAVARFKMPVSCEDFLTALEPYQCLIRCRDRYAVLLVVLSARLHTICDTNHAMRGERDPAHRVS